MELLIPGNGLIIWQLLTLLTIILVAVSWILILKTKSIDPTKKMIWLSGTLLVPVIGPILFFFSFASLKRVD